MLEDPVAGEGGFIDALVEVVSDGRKAWLAENPVGIGVAGEECAEDRKRISREKGQRKAGTALSK